MASKTGSKQKDTSSPSTSTTAGLNSYQKRALLISAFGNKQQQRNVEAKLRKQFSFDSATKSILEHTFNDIAHDDVRMEESAGSSEHGQEASSHNKESKSTSHGAETQNEYSIFPRANLDAETVIDIYPLLELIPAEIFSSLSQSATKFLDLCIRQLSISDNARIPRFVLQQAARINLIETEFLRNRLSRTLLYVATLIQFYNTAVSKKVQNLHYFLGQVELSSKPRAEDFIGDGTFKCVLQRTKETNRRNCAAQRGFDAATYLFGNGSGRLHDMNEVRLEQLITSFREEFTIFVFSSNYKDSRHCTSPRLSDKMLLRILTICLHLTDFSMRLSDLQKDLHLSTGRICNLLRSLGCSIKKYRPDEEEANGAAAAIRKPTEEEEELPSSFGFVASLSIQSVKNAVAARNDGAQNGVISQRLTNSLLRKRKRK